jgi:regulator of protease activity HflC (stomatin/prohibitin superfamily)
MKKIPGKIILSVAGLLIICGSAMYLRPMYKVYSRQKDGEAELAHAQAQREIVVAEAKAKFEAASLLAQADTVRAHGVARSNEIIGNSLKNNKEYLHWLWIEQLEKANVIYVPTEANLPVLEAGRAQQLKDAKTITP